MRIEAKLAELGLTLPPAPVPPPGVSLSFVWARRYQDRVYLAGHSAQTAAGDFAGPFGAVPSAVTPEAAAAAARATACALLGSLHRAIGDLDRVSAWLMIHGMVNADPGFTGTTQVINACSDLILDLFGPDIGAHARTAVGMATLPLNNTVTIAAEVALAPGST